MELSTAGLMEIAAHEGIVLSPYRDSVGVWTVGIGHTAAAGPPDPATMPKGQEMSLAAVLALFRTDIAKYAAAVARAVKVPLAQHEFDALVSFHFNTGAIGKASLVKKLNAGDRAGAAAGFDAWHKPPSIIDRRNNEKRLFETGHYSSAGIATIYPADADGRVLWSKGKRVDLTRALIPEPAPTVLPQAPTSLADAPFLLPSEPVQRQPDDPGVPMLPNTAAAASNARWGWVGIGIVVAVVAAAVAVVAFGL